MVIFYFYHICLLKPLFYKKSFKNLKKQICKHKPDFGGFFFYEVIICITHIFHRTPLLWKKTHISYTCTQTDIYMDILAFKYGYVVSHQSKFGRKCFYMNNPSSWSISHLVFPTPGKFFINKTGLWIWGTFRNIEYSWK